MIVHLNRTFINHHQQLMGLMNNRQNFLRIALLIIISLVFLPSGLSAQSKSEKRTVTFSCAVWDKLPQTPLFFFDGKKFQALKLKKFKRSDLFKLKDAEDFSLFIQSKTKDGELSYKRVGKTSILSNSSRILYLLSHQKTATARLNVRITGIDDSLGAFPPGTFRFVNFTSETLLIKFGDQKAKVKPQKVTTIKQRNQLESGLLPMMVGDSKGNVLLEDRLYVRSRGRKIVFISPPVKKGASLKIKYLSEIVPPQIPKPTPSSAP